MKLRIILACCAALALTVAVATATAGGGNSDNAKACQKDGWKSLVAVRTVRRLKNQGACVSYGANGGTYATGLIIPAGQTATFSNPRIGPNGICNTDTWGFQLEPGSGCRRSHHRLLQSGSWNRVWIRTDGRPVRNGGVAPCLSSRPDVRQDLLATSFRVAQ